MAIVLAVLGTSLYLRFESELDASVDQGLRSRAGDVTALVRQADSGLTDAGRSPLTERGESVAQIVDGANRVVDAPPQLRTRSLLTISQLKVARAHTVLIERGKPFEDAGPTRLLATPVRAQDRRLVVIVGASLEDRRGALRNLATLLLVGGPVALLLASGAGYGVAAAALKPVEAMRRRATAIGSADTGERLPVARADDEIGRLGDTLNAMIGRLEQTFQRERTFVSDASHELRTPLAVLKTELELALHSGRSAHELRDALESAAEETDRLTRLAQDLLVIARSDQDGLPVRLEPVDAAILLQDVRERHAGRSTGSGRRLTVMAPLGLVLMVDRPRIEQALDNLIDNALRHGVGEVRVTASESRDRGLAVVAVSDEGSGFPDGFAGEAFNRFTRADEARAGAGSGLGLAIVDAIARAHGGRAHALNQGHGGAVVSIELPHRGSS